MDSVEVKTDALDGEFSAGVFAKKSFTKDEILITCSTESLVYGNTRTYLTIQVSDDLHVLIPKPGVCINHSCEPNVRIDPCQKPIHFSAIRDIQPGEQLFFNYCSTEWSMAQPFNCQCKTKACVGLVSGAENLNYEQAQMVQEYASPYIKAKLSEKQGVEVREAVEGDFPMGVFATRDFVKGDIVINTEAAQEKVLLKSATYQTIQIDESQHFLVPKPTIFLNHSCDASANLDFGSPITVRALRDIPKGSQVTINYLATEYLMEQPFECQCKSSNCYGYIAGFHRLNEHQKAIILETASPYIAAKYAEEKARDDHESKKQKVE